MVEKLSRQMEAWRLFQDDIPDDVWPWVHVLPDNLVVVTSPNAPHHTVVLPVLECVVIRSEVGCIYAVTADDFAKKYREVSA